MYASNAMNDEYIINILSFYFTGSKRRMYTLLRNSTTTLAPMNQVNQVNQVNQQ